MYRIVSNFDLIQFVASDVLQYFGFILPVDATFGGGDISPNEVTHRPARKQVV